MCIVVLVQWLKWLTQARLAGYNMCVYHVDIVCALASGSQTFQFQGLLLTLTVQMELNGYLCILSVAFL